VYAVNPPNQLKLKLITIYWHFVDVLWLYLFAFFWLNH
jgi:cytochrome c oxidase subunit III